MRCVGYLRLWAFFLALLGVLLCLEEHLENICVPAGWTSLAFIRFYDLDADLISGSHVLSASTGCQTFMFVSLCNLFFTSI